MSDSTSKSERIIKEAAKQSMRDAISMIICDEADMVCKSKLVLDCGKSIDVANRILKLQANVSEEAGRVKSELSEGLASTPAWKDVNKAGELLKRGQHVWVYVPSKAFLDDSVKMERYFPESNRWHNGTIKEFAIPKPPERDGRKC
jgi:hypothetical protein